MEGLFVIFMFVAVMGITAVLFGGWLLVTIVRLIAGGVAAIFEPRPVHKLPAPAGWTCARSECRAANPSHARFCRRCGRAVAVTQQASVRRVAAML